MIHTLRNVQVHIAAAIALAILGAFLVVAYAFTLAGDLLLQFVNASIPRIQRAFHLLDGLYPKAREQ